MKKITLLVFMTISLVINAQNLWKKSTNTGTLNGYPSSKLDKENFEILELNFNDFKIALKESKKTQGIFLNIPDEKGKLHKFEIFENAVFAPSLAAKYPSIKSYLGYNKETGASLRMSVSKKGVQTMISYKDKPTVFMQPSSNNTTEYIVYNRLSKVNLPTEKFVCNTAHDFKERNDANNSFHRDANDQKLRKFRIAISVNGEYTQYHGGTVEGALAAMNATMTRVNAVFETDMAVTFELQDFPELIFTDPATDPYSDSLNNWNVELQNTLTDTIGNDAYDIGHMFGASGGGGNAGCIGCVCEDDTSATTDKNKGAGITSPSNGKPEGDTFDIDYVAHEIGHQMGANHTFSHNTEGRGVNAEPGSGSTIMGYAGITSSNVQENSDPYFHYHSIRQVLTNLETRTCWENNDPVTLTNNPPVADAGRSYTIPANTAYVLRGSATDADSEDNLTYCWEQTDDGQVTRSQFGPTRTVGAQARSLPPTTSPDRYIPKLSRVIAGELTETDPNSGDDWETVSSVSRDLNWALTVRDREPTGLGLGGQTSYDTMTVTVDGSAGPFVVSSQNSDTVWNVESTQTITWNVANTDTGNINTPTVNIKMSTDGGLTFPHILATNVPNNGSHDITVPTGIGTHSSCRVMVEGNGNIFFAVNSANISTQESEFDFEVENSEINICKPNDAIINLTYNTYLGFNGTTTITSENVPSGATVSINPSSVTANNTAIVTTVSGIDNLAVGSYDITLKGTSGSIEKTTVIKLNVFDSAFNELTLSTPDNEANEVSLTPTLSWNTDINAQSYTIQIAKDSNFNDIVSSDETITTNSYSPTNLEQTTQYFWRVKAKNDCGEGSYSRTYSFTTESCTVCTSSGSTTFETGTTRVKFNTIDNSTPLDKTEGYTDFTSLSTNVKRGEDHELIVHVNTDGNYQTKTVVWIDWNQDCDFDDPNETYDLGNASNAQDAPTVNSPLTITIPDDATLGSTVMRVTTKYRNAPTPCGDVGDAEVEDYTVKVEDNAASTKDFVFNGFGLYPNPSNGEININFNVITTNKVAIKLFDIRGRLVETKNFFNTPSQFSQRIHFNNSSAGLYLIRIENGNQQTTRKLLIK